MIWIDCSREHLEAIRAIFNDAIVNSTALYDYVPRSPEYMDAWFEAKQKGELPILGVLFTGILVALAGTQRPWWFYTVLLDGSLILLPALSWLGGLV